MFRTYVPSAYAQPAHAWCTSPAPHQPSLSRPHGLARFEDAQGPLLATVRGELRHGRVQTDWLSQFCPQLHGVGRDPDCDHLGIRSQQEARDFLAHPTLGERMRQVLRDIDRAVGRSHGQGSTGDTIRDVLGSELRKNKLWASLTLMAQATGDKQVQSMLKRHFRDYYPETMAVLRTQQDWECRATSVDPFNVERLVDRDSGRIDKLEQGLRKGHMDARVIPYVFPRMRVHQGGQRADRRDMNQRADWRDMTNREELNAFLTHPVLGANLKRLMLALLDPRNAGKSPERIFGGRHNAEHVKACMEQVRLASGTTDFMEPAEKILARFFPSSSVHASRKAPRP